MSDAIIFQLPTVVDPDRADTHWWRVVDGTIVERGCDSSWVDFAQGSEDGELKRVALAPSALVRLTFSESPPGLTPRQAASASRLSAVESSLGANETLHAASAMVGDGGEKVATAVVDNGRMLEWLDWANGLGADPHHVVPANALLPFADEWTEATFGADRLIGRDGLVFTNDADLTGQLVRDAPVRLLDAEAADKALAAAANPTLDLRTGRFARRRQIALDRVHVRELVILAVLIPFLALMWSLVQIWKLEQATDRLNAETVSLAQTALGRATTPETAERELSERFRSVVSGGLMGPLSGLYDALQNEQAVTATEISYRSDGTLSVTLAAPLLDSINRVLVALQRGGYRITAVPRQSPDGRAMVDATVRGTA